MIFLSVVVQSFYINCTSVAAVASSMTMMMMMFVLVQVYSTVVEIRLQRVLIQSEMHVICQMVQVLYLVMMKYY